MGQNKNDGMIMGGILGVALTYPALSAWIADFIGKTLPANWQLLGSWTIPIYAGVIGALVGYLIEKS